MRQAWRRTNEPGFMKTKCCQYEIDEARPVVAWNPYNGNVQCHNCGHVYVPADYQPMAGSPGFAARRERVAAGMLAALCSNPKLLTSGRNGKGLTDADRKAISDRKAKRAIEYADALIAALDWGA